MTNFKLISVKTIPLTFQRIHLFSLLKAKLKQFLEMEVITYLANI